MRDRMVRLVPKRRREEGELRRARRSRRAAERTRETTDEVQDGAEEEKIAEVYRRILGIAHRPASGVLMAEATAGPPVDRASGPDEGDQKQRRPRWRM